MNGDSFLLIVAAVGALILFAVVVLLFFGVFRYWIQALLTGVPLSVFEIIGMRLRRVNVRAVLHKLITARMSGAEITPRQMEVAYHTGVDLDKVTIAYIKASKENLGLRFEELVDAELQGRLVEKLKQS